MLRLLFAALAIAELTWVGLEYPRGEWIIHFLNWSRVFVALYFLLGAITLFHRSLCGSKSNHYDVVHQEGDSLDYSFLSATDSTSCGVKPDESDDTRGASGTNRLSWYHEVLWVLHTFAADTSFVCMVAYFSLFFEERYTWLGLLDVPRHVLYVVFMMVDTACSGIPVRLIHVVYANIVGAAYVFLTLIYLLTEVKVDLQLNPMTYPSFEAADKPLVFTAYLSIFLVAGFPVAHLFFFLLYKFRASVTSL